MIFQKLTLIHPYQNLNLAMLEIKDCIVIYEIFVKWRMKLFYPRFLCKERTNENRSSNNVEETTECSQRLDIKVAGALTYLDNPYTPHNPCIIR